MKNNSLRQFALDGLIGVIVVLILFASFAGYVINYGGFDSPDAVWEFLRFLFLFPKYDWGGFAVSPMPFALLTVFISLGITGSWLKEPGSRIVWLMHSFLVTACSLLVGLILFSIFFVFVRLLITSYGYDLQTYFDFMEIIPLVGGIGSLTGFVIGSLLGVIFNPSRRKTRMFTYALASVGASGGIGLGILALQIMQ